MDHSIKYKLLKPAVWCLVHLTLLSIYKNKFTSQTQQVQHMKQTVHFLWADLWSDSLAYELCQLLCWEVNWYQCRQTGWQSELEKCAVTADPEDKLHNCHKQPKSTKTDTQQQQISTNLCNLCLFFYSSTIIAMNYNSITFISALIIITILIIINSFYGVSAQIAMQSSVLAMVELSVHPSICYTLALCQKDTS